ncbi:MAG: tRNA preQ1(34) S-adenosylmethionine ribosyltransferase-isomerase QueA [Acidimicrobiia bacterium]
MKVADFHYDLPDTSIAQSAIEPRHDSRLLDTRDMSDHHFLDVADLLEPQDLLVVNDTKVRSARLVGRRVDTGGKVELLFLDRRGDGWWDALARPSRRLRPGIVLEFDGLSATVETIPDEGMVAVSLDADDEEAAIGATGSVPLPPYFTGALPDPDRYQTIFAREPGSAAAPTAGLHFTDEVLERLDERGVKMITVDLHVSLDTFRPMSVERIEDHEMHSEWCSVPAEAVIRIEDTRAAGARVVAVGTTVVRTLESMADGRGRVRSGRHRTDLFLRPGHKFKVVDALITNFHMPSSTLLVLLAAFMGPGWREAYETALARGYRFLSFGDAMYAERTRL